jgi:hypothetical protein
VSDSSDPDRADQPPDRSEPLADKGYSSTAIRTYPRKRGIRAAIPQRRDQRANRSPELVGPVTAEVSLDRHALSDEDEPGFLGHHLLYCGSCLPQDLDLGLQLRDPRPGPRRALLTRPALGTGT